MKAITKQTKANIRVYNMQSSNGNDVPNQFEIYTDNGKMFRSYNSNIAFIPNDEDIIYLGHNWDYSQTTSKYRNQFLGMDKKEILKRIENGTAKVVKL